MKIKEIISVVFESEMATDCNTAYCPKIGDNIHVGIGTQGGAGFSGVVTKIDGDSVHFKNDEGRTFKAPLKLVSPADTLNETDEFADPYDERSEFYNGDQVCLIDDGGEVFTVSQCDDERRKCWIGDEQGRGWYTHFSQIKHAE